MPGKTELVNKAVADRQPTHLHENMRNWLQETTGYDADLKTVQLVASLRLKFQQSEANQADLQARREAAERRLQERAQRAHERNESATKKAAEAVEKAKGKTSKVVDAAKKESKAAAQELKDANAAVEAAALDPFDPEAPMIQVEEKPKRKRTTKPAATSAPVKTTTTTPKPATKPRAARKPAKA